MNSKICCTCKVEKLRTEFYKRGRTVQSRCIDCCKNHIKSHYFEACPNCDGRKRKTTKLCANCSRLSQREIYPEELVEEVKTLYESGLTTWQIAKKLNTNQMRIRRILYRFNIQVRPNRSGKRGVDNGMWSGYKGITGSFFGSIKSSARVRNLEFNITKEFLWSLWNKQNCKCALSGLNITLPSSDDEYVYGDHTASLDRIDSLVGYVEGNVQWVHKWINKMKQNLQEPEFLYLCKMVVDNNDGKIEEVKITTLSQNKRRKGGKK